MAVNAAHVTVGFWLRAVDGSLLCPKELQGDREADWVESVWTHRLSDSHWSVTLTYCITHLTHRKTKLRGCHYYYLLSDQR